MIEAKGNVDRHNEHFVGRAAELRRLRQMVGLNKIGMLTTVHGLGGIGKTALATDDAYGKQRWRKSERFGKKKESPSLNPYR